MKLVKRRTPVFWKIFFIIASIGISLYILEFVLSVVIPKIGFITLEKSALQYRLKNMNVTSSSDMLSTENAPRSNTENFNWMANHVLHPYLGYVTDYHKDDTYDNFGFLGNGSIYKRDPNTVIVGVFGGSVAMYAYMDGKDEFIKQFQQLPQFQGKRIQIVSVAQGGYKQPQQLLALNYLLSLGAQFDIIINLDGFNDAVGAYAENFGTNITPYYPQHWDFYNYKSVNISALPILAEAGVITQQENILARFFQTSILKNSQLMLIVWDALDKVLNHLLYALNSQFDSIVKNQDKTYQVVGPEPTSGKEKIFEQSLGVWENSSLQMARIASTNGARYYHVLQPNQYLPGSKPMGIEERKIAIIDDRPDRSQVPISYRYEEGVKTLYPKMITTGEALQQDNGIAFLDMTQVFHDITSPIYTDPCCHYTPEGTRLLIREIVKKIAEDINIHPTQEIY